LLGICGGCFVVLVSFLRRGFPPGGSYDYAAGWLRGLGFWFALVGYMMACVPPKSNNFLQNGYDGKRGGY
jgi:hypothetical protein